MVPAGPEGLTSSVQFRVLRRPLHSSSFEQSCMSALSPYKYCTPRLIFLEYIRNYHPHSFRHFFPFSIGPMTSVAVFG